MRRLIRSHAPVVRALAIATVPAILCITLGACATAAPPADRDVIAPPGAPTVAPYSPAVRSGNLVFLSGQIGIDPDTRALVSGGVAAETRQALENVRIVLAAAGLAPVNVVKCTVFLADMRDYEAMNDVYGRFFGVAPPARSAIGVNGLPLGARVEIECIAGART